MKKKARTNPFPEPEKSEHLSKINIRMNTNILVLQGGGEGAHKWDLPFINTLKGQLGDNYEIHFPKMPEEENPQYQAWVQKIEQVLLNLTDPVIVLGHSLGGSVIVKYLSGQRIECSIPALFLISSPFWGQPDWEADEFKLEDNFAQKINSVQKFFIYHSQDDPFVPFSHNAIYKNICLWLLSEPSTMQAMR